MAGSYPNTPGPRLAYDEDGTVMWRANSLSGGTFQGGGYITGMLLPPTEQSASVKREYNDEDTDPVFSAGGSGAVDYGFSWIWPEKRDIYGFYGYATDNDSGRIGQIHTSTDSRNGVTGSFTTEASNPNQDPQSGAGAGIPDLIQPIGNHYWSVEQSYREFIHPLSSTGTTAVRARVRTDKTVGGDTDPAVICAFHWYGEIADGANPDRLLFIDADTGLEYGEVQDWGDIPRGSVHDKDIYLLNNSATLSATSNVLTFEGLYQDSYTWYTIKDESSTAPAFSTTLTVDGPLAPGARYPTASTEHIVVRLTVDPDENLGPAAARLQLVTGDWST